jgi:cytochrome c-type biogenesis protein CcmH
VTGFVGAAAALLVLAAAFVAWPLARRRAQLREERRALNVELYRDRLAELEAERERGEIPAADFDTLKAELGLALLEDAGTDDAQTPAATRRLAVAGGAALALIVAAVAVYREIGALDLVVLDRDRALLAQEAPSAERLAAWADGLEQHLARHPDDAKSWYLFGHARLRQDRYEGAAAAFETLSRLTGDDPAVLSALAQARYMADKGVVSDANRAVMMKVLAMSPHEPNVREMLALDAFRREQFAEAAQHLENALAGGVGGARAQALEHALERARAAAGGVPVAASAAPSAASEPAQASDAGIRVRVALAPGLEVNDSARVFVIAREPGGPPMPVAVRVLDPAQLPAELVLSDADAMQPTRVLSGFEKVDVVARLSRSGTAVRADGDLESAVVTVARSETKTVALDIGG